MLVDHWPCAETHSSALLVLIHLTFMTTQRNMDSYDLHVTDELTSGFTEKLGNLQLYHRVAGISLCCLSTCVKEREREKGRESAYHLSILSLG